MTNTVSQSTPFVLNHRIAPETYKNGRSVHSFSQRRIQHSSASFLVEPHLSPK